MVNRLLFGPAKFVLGWSKSGRLRGEFGTALFVYGVVLLIALLTVLADSEPTSAQTEVGGSFGVGGYLKREPGFTIGPRYRHKRHRMRVNVSEDGQETVEERPQRRRYVRRHYRRHNRVQESVRVTPPVQETVSVTSSTPRANEGNVAFQPDNPLDKMIGQLLIVGFQGTSPNDVSVQKLAAQIHAGSVGGVLFLSHNITSPKQVAALTKYLQNANPDMPLIIAVDQEGGVVQRLASNMGFTEFPSAKQLGRGNDPLVAYTVYKNMAAELLGYGFNLNLGPVVDLERNTDSLIVTAMERSYGPQPKHVTAFAKAFCLAHRETGVLTALKHFPGHGSSSGDTHTGNVDITATWKPDELDPYGELIKAGLADIIMMGHISHREMSDEAGLPASLSEKAVTLLRSKLGFKGVIVTDDLEMGAVSLRFPPEESAVRALKAGDDLLIISNLHTKSLELPERTIVALRQAVESGRLKRDQIAASHERVMVLKQKLRTTVSAKHDDATKVNLPVQ
jgi:beta-N-acetylhexosaminidase